MNRRSFLKMMFGGLATATVAPTIDKWVPAGGSITVELPGPFPRFIDMCYTYACDFNLDTDVKSLVMKMEGGSQFFMRQLGLWFDPTIPYKSLVSLLDFGHLSLESGKRLVMDAPIWILGSGASAIHHHHHLASPLLINDQMSVSLNSLEVWTPPPGIKGKILIDGIKRIPFNTLSAEEQNAYLSLSLVDNENEVENLPNWMEE